MKHTLKCCLCLLRPRENGTMRCLCSRRPNHRIIESFVLEGTFKGIWSNSPPTNRDRSFSVFHILAYSHANGFDYYQAESSKKNTEDPPPCICPKSHCTSGLRTIADLLNTGAVCGVPTDTVYALAASCRHPQAIEKVYRIKVRIQNWLVTWMLLASHRSVMYAKRNGNPFFQVVLTQNWAGRV